MERISSMILAVLFLFLVNEVPQIVLISMVMVYDFRVLSECYVPMGEILDTLGLLNSSLHFFLFLAISRQYRASLCQVTLRRGSPRRRDFLSSDANGISLSVRRGSSIS